MAIAMREVRVRKDQLEPDMILAKDMVFDDGRVLIKEGTLLTKEDIQKIRSYNAEYINIAKHHVVAEDQDRAVSTKKIVTSDGVEFDIEVNEEKEPEIIETISRAFEGKKTPSEFEALKVENDPKFIEFSRKHSAIEAKIKKHIIAISQGGEIVVDELYDMPNSIVTDMDIKGDLFAYLNGLQMRADHTFSHSVNVAILCNLFAYWLGYKEEEVVEITLAGILHDIGKLKIDEKILNKPTKLTADEFEMIKKHTIFGYNMVEYKPLSRNIKNAILMHHKRPDDDDSYPFGVSYNNVSNYAKIVAICDIYDAMTGERPYRKKHSPFEVIHYLERDSLGVLDTRFLFVFLSKISNSLINSWVKLSNGDDAKIIYINSNNLSRPIVRTTKNQYFNLSERKDINILDLL